MRPVSPSSRRLPPGSLSPCHPCSSWDDTCEASAKGTHETHDDRFLVCKHTLTLALVIDAAATIPSCDEALAQNDPSGTLTILAARS